MNYRGWGNMAVKGVMDAIQQNKERQRIADEEKRRLQEEERKRQMSLKSIQAMGTALNWPTLSPDILPEDAGTVYSTLEARKITEKAENILKEKDKKVEENIQNELNSNYTLIKTVSNNLGISFNEPPDGIITPEWINFNTKRINAELDKQNNIESAERSYDIFEKEQTFVSNLPTRTPPLSPEDKKIKAAYYKYANETADDIISQMKAIVFNKESTNPELDFTTYIETDYFNAQLDNIEVGSEEACIRVIRKRDELMKVSKNLKELYKERKKLDIEMKEESAIRRMEQQQPTPYGVYTPRSTQNIRK